ncbi:MAG: phosphate ABC transporter permease, partial [Chromatiales bacterium]|nr:phosphate ABC transporter permease [Chromatiales bacterium]
MSADNLGLSDDSALLDEGKRQRLYRWRRGMDVFSRWLVGIGGISVIISLTLIFIYLFTEVMPMLTSASIKPVAEYPVPGEEGRTMALSIDRFLSVGLRVGENGTSTFFRPANGEVIETRALPLPTGAKITSTASSEPRTRLHVFGLSNGKAMLMRHEYVDTYPEGRPVVQPGVTFPLGEKALTIDPQGHALSVI